MSDSSPWVGSRSISGFDGDDVDCDGDCDGDVDGECDGDGNTGYKVNCENLEYCRQVFDIGKGQHTPVTGLQYHSGTTAMETSFVVTMTISG